MKIHDKQVFAYGIVTLIVSPVIFVLSVTLSGQSAVAAVLAAYAVGVASAYIGLSIWQSDKAVAGEKALEIYEKNGEAGVQW